MKRVLLFATLIFVLHFNVFAQKDSLLIKKIYKTKINYKSYVLAGYKLFALNDSGKLVIWDLNKFDTIQFAYNKPSMKYTAIAKDKENNVFLGTSRGEIFKIETEGFNYSFFLKAKYTIRYMCFNSSNKLFLIVSKAVYDPISRQYWNNFENHTTGFAVTRKSFIFFRKKLKKYFSMPQYTFLDNEDRWWMTATYGEFGSDIQIFDTKKEQIVSNVFDNIDLGSLSPRSVFEDGQGNIYISDGLQHFMNFGKILKIDKNRNTTTVFDTNKEFIGPGTYNKNDNSIYFASTTGFYKAALSHDKLAPELLFNTNFSWDREPMAIGVAMTIIKLDFTIDNKLLFLSKNDGFGIFDGKKLLLLK